MTARPHSILKTLKQEYNDQLCLVLYAFKQAYSVPHVPFHFLSLYQVLN